MVVRNEDGETWSVPMVINDTPLDDRDGGILAFGEKDVIVTSFTNTVEFQRKRKSADAYNHSYLDKVTPEDLIPHKEGEIQIPDIVKDRPAAR